MLLYKKAIVIKHLKSNLLHLDSESTYFVPVNCVSYGFYFEELLKTLPKLNLNTYLLVRITHQYATVIRMHYAVSRYAFYYLIRHLHISEPIQIIINNPR